jgi:dienelactone hydrolase
MVTVYPSDRATAGLIVAHGAGGGQTSSFVVRAGQELAARGILVATFDFPYITAGRSAPDKPAVLDAHWRTTIDDVRTRSAFARLPLFIGGKSMGGRISSQVAAAGVDGVALVYFGYPLHPPGRPEQRSAPAHISHPDAVHPRARRAWHVWRKSDLLPRLDARRFPSRSPTATIVQDAREGPARSPTPRSWTCSTRGGFIRRGSRQR